MMMCIISFFLVWMWRGAEWTDDEKKVGSKKTLERVELQLYMYASGGPVCGGEEAAVNA